MTTRSHLLDKVRDVLEGYKAGALTVGYTRKQLGQLVRRLTSHVNPVDGKVFRTYWSDLAAKGFPSTKGTEVDHAMPVACIVEDMMYEMVKPDGSIDVAWMSLEYGYHLVRVTIGEHKKLSRASMPSGWKEGFENSWKARYIAARIEVNRVLKNQSLVPI